jgi:hypothetical protein
MVKARRSLRRRRAGEEGRPAPARVAGFGGLALSEILSGEEEAVFVHEDCEGDPEVAAAAFALVHSPRGRHSLG